MTIEGLPEPFIDSFANYYERLVKGETGLIPESEIEPVEELIDLEGLGAHLSDVGRRALDETVLIKLNGGLGTSMGLAQAKSLLEVRSGLTFLDIIARQALHDGTPLVLMNSFATDQDALEYLQRYPALHNRGLPLRFVQNKAPKIVQADLSPVKWPDDPALEWCPPGHGDIYLSLVTSGTLDNLLNKGYRYGFVSNSDNLGAHLDTTILGYVVQEGIPFLMEAAERTQMDKKGGHLARHRDGRLLLRESAQCPSEDMNAFQDVRRHRFFNTNSLWLDLSRLKELMKRRNNQLGLPMIRNAKTVDPRNKQSTPVFQIETAMGAAVSVFEGAEAIRVPRRRFAPVKTTNELLAVRSDAYVLTEDFRLVPNPYRRLGPLMVRLDPEHYKMISELEARFPHGPPSLVDCSILDVEGDFKFGRGVVAKGEVHLTNVSGGQELVREGTVLEGPSRSSARAGWQPPSWDGS